MAGPEVFFESLPTLVDIIRKRAELEPNKVAVRFLLEGETESEKIDYKTLDRKARSVAAYLQSVAKPNDRAILLFEPGIAFIYALLGCFYARIIAVPAYPPTQTRKFDRLKTIIQDSNAHLILTEKSLIDSLEPFLKEISKYLEKTQIINVDELNYEKGHLWKNPLVDPTDIAFFQYTSGSTGSPKGVIVLHNNILANAQMITQHMNVNSNSVSVSWLPIYHDLGLIGCILQPLYNGCLAVLMSPAAFLAKPVRWLSAITKYKGTISGSPNFGFDLCVRKINLDEMHTLDLSSLEVLFNGAEPVRADSIRNFINKFKKVGLKSDSFMPIYGLAEATLFVSAAPLKKGPNVIVINEDSLESGNVTEWTNNNDANLKKELVSCGKGSQRQTLHIVHPEKNLPLADRMVGEIWLHGPQVTEGYWNNNEETKNIFRGTLNDISNSHITFLKTGDLGFKVKDELYVTGRIKDLIIVNGRNLYPHDIEFTVEKNCPNIRTGCCVAVNLPGKTGEVVGLVAEVKDNFNEEVYNMMKTSILNSVREEHEVGVSVIAFIDPGKLPKTSSGKLQRILASRLLLNNNFKTKFIWHSPSFIPTSHITDEVRDLKSLTLEKDISPSASKHKKNTDISHLAIENNLRHWIATSTNIPIEQIKSDMLFSEYGIDSINTIEIISKIMEHYQIQIQQSIFWSYPTITELALQIKSIRENNHK